jgi:hypothetical protein
MQTIRICDQLFTFNPTADAIVTVLLHAPRRFAGLIAL